MRWSGRIAPTFGSNGGVGEAVGVGVAVATADVVGSTPVSAVSAPWPRCGSQIPSAAPSAAITTNRTTIPSTLRRRRCFVIGGGADSGGGTVPAAYPVLIALSCTTRAIRHPSRHILPVNPGCPGACRQCPLSPTSEPTGPTRDERDARQRVWASRARRASARLGQPARVQAAVDRVRVGHQLLVRPALHDAAAVDHDHLVGGLRGGQPVRDRD